MAGKRYTFDSKSSQITVQAFAEGLAGIVEHRPSFFARNFSGEIEFDSDKLDGSLNLTAKTGSLEIMDEVTKHDRNAIERVLKPQGVALVIKATHHCMRTRGIRKQGSELMTSRMLGCFRDNCQEFLAMTHASGERGQ